MYASIIISLVPFLLAVFLPLVLSGLYSPDELSDMGIASNQSS